jgi:hypothetical protein
MSFPARRKDGVSVPCGCGAARPAQGPGRASLAWAPVTMAKASTQLPPSRLANLQGLQRFAGVGVAAELRQQRQEQHQVGRQDLGCGAHGRGGNPPQNSQGVGRKFYHLLLVRLEPYKAHESQSCHMCSCRSCCLSMGDRIMA